MSSKKNLCQQVIYLFICLVVFVTVLIALQEVGLNLVMFSTCVIVYQVIKVNTQCVMMILLPFLGFFFVIVTIILCPLAILHIYYGMRILLLLLLFVTTGKSTGT